MTFKQKASSTMQQTAKADKAPRGSGIAARLHEYYEVFKAANE